MNHIESVDHRNAELVHRNVLDFLNLLSCNGSRPAGNADHIQERADFVLAHEVSDLRGVDQSVCAEGLGSELHHLSGLFF